MGSQISVSETFQCQRDLLCKSSTQIHWQADNLQRCQFLNWHRRKGKEEKEKLSGHMNNWNSQSTERSRKSTKIEHENVGFNALTTKRLSGQWDIFTVIISSENKPLLFFIRSHWKFVRRSPSDKNYRHKILKNFRAKSATENGRN